MKVQDLHLDYPMVEDILKAFVFNEIRKFKFSSVVLGLSGGIDSAVVCELAVRALGRKNVLGLMMPYASSSPESLEHAELMIRKLGIEAEEMPITPVVDAFFSTVPQGERLRRGNIMARTRMIFLYDVSARDGRLVTGTSNKTELLLGYGTMFGDMASAINPVGDYPGNSAEAGALPWPSGSLLEQPGKAVPRGPHAPCREGSPSILLGLAEECAGKRYDQAGVDSQKTG